MGKIRILLLSMLCLSSGIATAQCAMGYTGSIAIGPTGTFTTLKQAFDSLRVHGLSGNVVLELQSTYTGLDESYPIRPGGFPCASPSRTVTVRPAAGAGPVVLNTDSIATIDLDSTKYLTFDGRNGGTGTVMGITVRNTSLTGHALRLRNDASHNRFKYLDIQGANDSELGGVIHIGPSNRITGNDSNRIDTSFIHASVAFPANAFYARGTSGKENTGNSITGCNITDFFKWGGVSCAIKVSSENEKFTITGNSIYQSAVLSYTNATMFGINMDTRLEAGHIVTHNFIGGTAPNAAGTKMRLTGQVNFRGIYVTNNHGISNNSRIDSNTVTNILLQTTTEVSHVMISMGYIMPTGSSGSAGSLTGNLVGSHVSDTSIKIVALHGSSIPISVYGIVFSPRVTTATDTVQILRNTVSGIFIDSVSTGNVEFTGLVYHYTDNVISSGVNRFVMEDNVVGNVTRRNSIYSRKSGTLTGIHLHVTPGYAVHAIVRNNTVANLSIRKRIMDGGVHILRGIVLSGEVNGSLSILDNEIKNLTQESSTASPLYGIYAHSFGKATISGNRISYLRSDYSYDNIEIAGIKLNNSTISGTATETILSHNTIHTIYCNSTHNSYEIKTYGIIVENHSGKTTRVNNNMIRLGLDTSGAPLTNQQSIIGIEDRSGRTDAVHNSVYIGGNQTVLSEAITTCYRMLQTTAAGRVLRNNIFANQRANSATIFNNTSINCSTGFTVLPATMDYNIYYHPGANGRIGWFNGEWHDLPAWKTITLKDTNSFAADPNFVNANGNGEVVDLHIAIPSPVESAGSPSGTSITDIDGQIRANFSPVDIGADAGNFLPLPDLSITATAPASPLIAGANVNFTVTEQNLAVSAAGSHQVVVYLSSDNILTPGANGDTVLVRHTVAGLAGNTSTGLTVPANIPCNLSAGAGFIFLVADGNNEIAESNENNNVTSLAVTLNKPAVTISNSDTTICAGASVVLNATGAVTYSWSPATGLSATNSATVTATPGTTTTYVVTGNTNGCLTQDSVKVTVGCVPTSIGAPAILNSYSIYPNPARDEIYVRYLYDSFKEINVTVYDVHGKALISVGRKTINTSQSWKIPLKGLAAGIYIIEINEGGMKSYSRIVITR